MNFKTSFCFFATAFLCAVVPAAPGGPGGGNQPGGGEMPGGGNQPGGGGSLTYDAVISVTTNANCLIRGGIIYGWTSSLGTSVEPGSSVSALADGAFAGNTAIKTVNLSNTSISELPADAFCGCTSLETVVLPSGCTAIGANAFAGCSALSDLTAAGVEKIGADAFRGCSSLTALPDGAAEIGEYAFANTALTEVDLSGRTIKEGVFSCCSDLASVSSLPTELPDAAFCGCTSLDRSDWSDVVKFGQASLAGIPATQLELASNAIVGSYAFAADVATVATQFYFADSSWPEYEAGAFLGRGYSLDGEAAAVFDAVDLVDWLADEAGDVSSSVVQPADYSTASLEAWLSEPSNEGAIFRFCYGDDTTLAAVLSVDGTTFKFTDTTRGAVAVTPVATYDLSDDFSSDKVVLEELLDGVYSAVAADQSAAACFMRLKFSKNWQ